MENQYPSNKTIELLDNLINAFGEKEPYNFDEFVEIDPDVLAAIFPSEEES